MTQRCVVLCLLWPLFAFAQLHGQSGRQPTLRTVQGIHGLSNTEARKAFSVELQGVVTYSDPEWGLLFIRDQTGSIYVDAHGTSTLFPLGTRVQVNGVTGAGDVAPTVVQAKIRILGREPPPKPEQRAVAELDAGVADSSWVVTEGVLHPCDQTWTRVCFRIFDGKSFAWLVVPEKENAAAQRLMGATVRVTGVSGVHLDSANRRVAAQLFVNSLADIQIEEPALPDSFASTPISLGSLRKLDLNRRFLLEVHVRGTVTWASPTKLFLQDSSGTVFVETAVSVSTHVGNTVDVVGFPNYGEFGPELLDSKVRVSEIQSAIGIAPLETTAADVLKRSLDGKQVRLKAHLISQDTNKSSYVYQLADGDQRFSATLLRTQTTNELVGLSRNSDLQLTGVAVIRSATAEWPESLMVLISSPADIVVLGGNGWLTPKRGLAILSAMALCVIVPLVWVTQLRRTVRKQTTIMRARLEHEMHLETKFKRLFGRNLAGVFSWRSDGTIVDCNMAFARMLGFLSHEELIGRSYWEFHVDPTQREQVCGALQVEALSNQEASLRRDDGSIVHLLQNITPVQTPEGVLYETTAIDVTQLRKNQAELQNARDAAVYESLNDPLTGLPNRRHLLDRLQFLIAKAGGDSGIIALLFIDLDGFKLINDSLGHPTGDAMLVQVSDCLRSRVRRGDILGRLGGDEFMVILDSLHANQEATVVAESLLESISNPFRVEGHDLSIGASIGISVFPDNATSPEELMRQADSAMYAAKREGKNRVMIYTPEIGTQMHERLSLENQLRGAIARGEISVHYQPEFEVVGSRLIRFEALARWTHPTLGNIPPVKFIPIAEESGLIVTLGAYIMQRACIEAVRWQSIAPNPIQVAVNVSSIQFRTKGFVEDVSAILQQTGLRPELLQIELTESVMLAGVEHTAATMNRLHELGVSMAIDDFGTGYSSLSYLPSLTFDALKIDRSFVMNLDTQPDGESMIRMLVALAQNLGMRVIVEGVENAEQLELIRALGANEVQGYLMGRPTATPVEAFLCPTKETPASSNHRVLSLAPELVS